MGEGKRLVEISVPALPQLSPVAGCAQGQVSRRFCRWPVRVCPAESCRQSHAVPVSIPRTGCSSPKPLPSVPGCAGFIPSSWASLARQECSTQLWEAFIAARLGEEERLWFSQTGSSCSWQRLPWDLCQRNLCSSCVQLHSRHRLIPLVPSRQRGTAGMNKSCCLLPVLG